MSNYSNPQPAWISASTAEMATREREFFRSVYGWMFGGLLLTTLAAFWVATSAAMQQMIFGNPIVMFGLIVAEIGIVFYLGLRLTRMSPAAAATAFLV